MGFRLGFSITAAILIAARLGFAASAGPTVTFQINDELSQGQMEEEMAVSINHLPVGTLKIGGVKRSDSLTVTVPAAATYHYDLCGQLKQKTFFCMIATHKIDNGGDLTDLNGRALFGFNSRETVFYLLDKTEGKSPVDLSGVTAGRSCADTVAEVISSSSG